jgi:hypothetical protein
LDGTTNNGKDLTVGRDGRQDFIFREAGDNWAEFWIRRGNNWKKYD